jgi:hypothetical protein
MRVAVVLVVQCELSWRQRPDVQMTGAVFVVLCQEADVEPA